jgi:hypothetical protein
MSAKGGYLIIDLKGVSLTSGTATKFDGIAVKVANPYNKATLISGLVVGNVAYADFFAPFVKGENVYSAAVEIGGESITITVATNDNVTVTVA